MFEKEACMSVFGTWLQGQLNGRGWDQRQAALRIGVKDNTVHYWIRGDRRPGVANAIKIALALEVPIEEVLLYAGHYPIVEQAAHATPDEAAQRRADLLAALPQFAAIIDVMARQPPERQAVLIEIIRRLLLDYPSD